VSEKLPLSAVKFAFSALTLLVGWQERQSANDVHMAQLMPLPPIHLLLHKNPECFTFLVPAYPDCPGK